MMTTMIMKVVMMMMMMMVMMMGVWLNTQSLIHSFTHPWGKLWSANLDSSTVESGQTTCEIV